MCSFHSLATTKDSDAPPLEPPPLPSAAGRLFPLGKGIQVNVHCPQPSLFVMAACFVVVETESLCHVTWLSWNSLHRPGWPLTPRDSPPSATTPEFPLFGPLCLGRACLCKYHSQESNNLHKARREVSVASAGSNKLLESDTGQFILKIFKYSKIREKVSRVIQSCVHSKA